MPFGLGFFATVGAGAGAAGSFDLLETQVLGSSTASVTFSSLSTYASTYQHLQLRYVVRSDRSGEFNDPFRFTLNGDSGANYTFHKLFGNGSSVTSYGEGNITNLLIDNGIAGATVSANIYTAGVIDFADAFETTKNKTFRALYAGQNSTTAYQIGLGSGVRLNTAAISSLTIDPIGNLVTGSRFSLYGIKAA
jgi:hypothetical protein